MVRAVAGLGSDLGIATVAEGVETEDQAHRARREGIHEMQGFALARPRPASELAKLFGMAPEENDQPT